MNVKYFDCKPGRGKFALLASLKPDKRSKKISGNFYVTLYIYKVIIVYVCMCSLLSKCDLGVKYIFKSGTRHRPMCAWFLEITFMPVSVCVYECVSTPEAINN